VSNRTRSKAQDLQLGVLECKVYHNGLLNNKSQIYFNCWLQLNISYKTKKENDLYCECHKVVDYCKEKGDVNSSNHKCLVERNDINKTKSWVNYDLFALCLNNYKPII
jgi:hypothetical protein